MKTFKQFLEKYMPNTYSQGGKIEKPEVDEKGRHIHIKGQNEPENEDRRVSINRKIKNVEDVLRTLRQ